MYTPSDIFGDEFNFVLGLTSASLMGGRGGVQNGVVLVAKQGSQSAGRFRKVPESSGIFRTLEQFGKVPEPLDKIRNICRKWVTGMTGNVGAPRIAKGRQGFSGGRLLRRPAAWDFLRAGGGGGGREVEACLARVLHSEARGRVSGTPRSS